jgi:two-component system, NarL family, nitrate/nitrite response regulator NarL
MTSWMASPIRDDAGPRVLVVSEDPLARRGLSAELAADPGVSIAGQAGAGEDLRAAVERTAADAVLLDLGADLAAGLTALRDLEGVPAIALLPRADLAMEALAAGARGAFLRESDPAMIASAFTPAIRGAIVLDPAIGTELARARPMRELPSREALTAREREVLELLAQGLSNKAIARALDVTDHTAKFHVTSIMNKLGAETRTEAVVLAARLGLVVL